MNTTLLLSILLCALSTGVIAFITLLSKKKDDNRFEKITAIATFLTSITTIVVGIATISVAKHQEDIERLQNQPLFNDEADLVPVLLCSKLLKTKIN